MPWLLICSAEVSQERSSSRWKPVFVAAALGWAWQQALISTFTFLPEREFLPAENCHSGELCTGGLIVGCECGAAWHPALPLLLLLLLALHLSRPSFTAPFLFVFSKQTVWTFGCVWDYLGSFTCFAALCLLPVSTACLPHCEDVSHLQVGFQLGFVFINIKMQFTNTIWKYNI